MLGDVIRILKQNPRGLGIALFAVGLAIYGLMTWDLQALAISGAVLAFVGLVVAIVHRRGTSLSEHDRGFSGKVCRCSEGGGDDWTTGEPGTHWRGGRSCSCGSCTPWSSR